ncbi:aspartyl-phosphate phosphatase Spo0E family protein [Planococcus sp. N028]|uniref:Aspartyl-phosphate phosphatase Spo0E family protein n=1 Tax=Planococcus shixiaomingii TaxID=3058393 RepID=A0ABT8N325_9BACL|nr:MULTISPECIES: aspartyl-phosphate phosphatase Spo0E family protein [unclassified Planococcus (in: firmicutes)]MDN7242292.1 aspartyl-phosphate phosphatase Spo0E family protein [Planococcus sp. N028]WKA54546.1 aspartyl-phosphate phosphatase Spo0E family protein [Planococcus sp. N022]
MISEESKFLISLKIKIDSLREKLIAVGLLKGLSHPDTIKISQELDEWLDRYQNFK